MMTANDGTRGQGKGGHSSGLACGTQTDTAAAFTITGTSQHVRRTRQRVQVWVRMLRAGFAYSASFVMSLFSLPN